MKVVFAGTPEFAKVALHAILNSSHEVVAVYTQPDRPSGRGLKLKASDVKILAQIHEIPVYQPESLKNEQEVNRLRSIEADIMVVAAYGLLLPQAVLDIPPLGCINIHASLLPRWRGAAPIHRAIEAGDLETGIAIMQMEAGLDTGPVLLQKVMPIKDNHSYTQLHDELADVGGRLVVEYLDKRSLGPVAATPQLNLGVTYASKLRKEEGLINWSASAEAIDRRIRAFNPFPGSFTFFRGEMIKCWQSEVIHLESLRGTPGQILKITEQGIVVACLENALLLKEIQKPGGRSIPSTQFIQNQSVVAGEFFTQIP